MPYAFCRDYMRFIEASREHQRALQILAIIWESVTSYYYTIVGFTMICNLSAVDEDKYIGSGMDQINMVDIVKISLTSDKSVRHRQCTSTFQNVSSIIKIIQMRPDESRVECSAVHTQGLPDFVWKFPFYSNQNSQYKLHQFPSSSTQTSSVQTTSISIKLSVQDTSISVQLKLNLSVQTTISEISITQDIQ